MYNKVSDARKHEQTCNIIFFSPEANWMNSLVALFQPIPTIAQFTAPTSLDFGQPKENNWVKGTNGMICCCYDEDIAGDWQNGA